MGLRPELTRVRRDSLTLVVDTGALERGLLVAFSDRRGGASRPPFDTLNLGARVGDDPSHVADNRERVARACGVPAERLVLARQVHGTEVLEVGRVSTGVVGSGDGLLARGPGPVLAMLTADCAPVVLAGPAGVAVLHAGWRGLAGGIIEAGVQRLGRVDAAWVGPCIHACCYEVGADVTDAFAHSGLPVAGPRRVDPGRAAAFALHRAGVVDVAASVECTHCDPAYFSYRRDGVTGRQGAFVSVLAG